MSKLNELIGKKKDLNNQIIIERRKQHLEFKENYKGLIKILDILAILCIVFNFGALVITDYMVAKQDWQEAKAQNTTITYIEANPIASNIHNYEGAVDPIQKLASYKLMFALFKQGILWAILLFSYLWLRSHIYSKKDLKWLIFFVCFYFCILGYDFYHDLGLLLAKFYH